MGVSDAMVSYVFRSFSLCSGASMGSGRNDILHGCKTQIQEQQALYSKKRTTLGSINTVIH
jgi:hypothetical protein